MVCFLGAGKIVQFFPSPHFPSPLDLLLQRTNYRIGPWMREHNGSDYTAGGLPASFADDYVLTFSAALSVRPTADPCCHAGARSCILAKKSAEIRPSDPRAASSIIYVHVKQSANSLQQGGIVSDLLPALPGQLAAVEVKFRSWTLSVKNVGCTVTAASTDLLQAPTLYMSRGKRNIVVVGAGWAGWASMKVDDFLRPFLLVALFKPPEELSAGSIGESIIAPLAHYLQEWQESCAAFVLGRSGERVGIFLSSKLINQAIKQSINPSSKQASKHVRKQASQAKHSQAQPSPAKPSQAQPSSAKLSQAQPSSAKPSQDQPSQAKPSQAKPRHAKPSQAKPSKAKQSKAKQASKQAI
eukprot:g58323.t1